MLPYSPCGSSSVTAPAANRFDGPVGPTGSVGPIRSLAVSVALCLLFRTTNARSSRQSSNTTTSATTRPTMLPPSSSLSSLLPSTDDTTPSSVLACTSVVDVPAGELAPGDPLPLVLPARVDDVSTVGEGVGCTVGEGVGASVTVGKVTTCIMTVHRASPAEAARRTMLTLSHSSTPPTTAQSSSSPVNIAYPKLSSEYCREDAPRPRMLWLNTTVRSDGTAVCKV
mmetsp:Transcript_6700/g.21680  ORF Transcript_6700/g.21680 Transcript_6700/m.21680 type:complete len:226 (+) Transcript_6700:230-907(+)